MKKRFSRRNKIEITLETMRKIEAMLKKREGENYKGLISISCYLTNYYFTNYYCNFPANYTLAEDVKTCTIAKIVNFDILEWLLKNFNRYRNDFNIHASIKRAEKIVGRK